MVPNTGRSPDDAIDLVEEFRLRRWARANFVPAGERDERWHPVILNEMARRDAERSEEAGARRPAVTSRSGQSDRAIHGPHPDSSRSLVLLRVPLVSDF